MSKSVHLVVQRYRSCRILLDESEWVSVGEDPEHCGLLVYVSFEKSATQESTKNSASTVLNLPVLTTGLWGDGVSRQMSVLDLAAAHPNRASIVIVPQANLISKVKKQGKSIQYHGQVEKSIGEELYRFFVDEVRSAVLKRQCEASGAPLPSWFDEDHRDEELWSAALENSFCRVVSGSFGKRQGLELSSEMGPFCHVLQC